MTAGNPNWKVDDLGKGAYVFRWRPGFYASPFFVTSDGVCAVDPIDDRAAAAYRAAIASVTEAPVVAVLYTHDHRDHACGARVLSEDAEVIAHPRAAERIARRGADDIRIPTRLVADEEVMEFGGVWISARYFGPNHSDSNIALFADTDGGRLLVFSDVIEPGVAPYRDLADSDLAGIVSTLDALEHERFDLVMGGHLGPGPRSWADDYRTYFHELVDITAQEFASMGGQEPLPGENGVQMTERVRNETCARVAERLRPRYGHWRGFTEWAPLNANRTLSYLITGN